MRLDSEASKLYIKRCSPDEKTITQTPLALLFITGMLSAAGRLEKQHFSNERIDKFDISTLRLSFLMFHAWSAIAQLFTRGY
jgi:hypothetical protein